jgi:hypothetical protein
MMTQLNLEQFIGSELFYRHFTGLVYTEGVKYVADHCGAYWLIDAIASYQFSPKIQRDEMLKDFQLWTLQVNPDKSALLICGRDAEELAFSQAIEYTDFPLDEIRFYLSNNVLMLPSEY